MKLYGRINAVNEDKKDHVRVALSLTQDDGAPEAVNGNVSFVTTAKKAKAADWFPGEVLEVTIEVK